MNAMPLLCISVKQLSKGSGNGQKQKLHNIQCHKAIHYVCVSV